MTWLFSRAMMSPFANLPCSQALVAVSSPGTCSAGEPSAQLNVMPTAQPFWRNDKQMDCSRLSQFGLTLRLLTADHGEALLTSYLADFRARTSALPERGTGLTVNAQGSGKNFRESLAKYDPASHSLKTAQLSLIEDSTGCSVTLPRSGSMRNGACYQQPTLAPTTCANESGFWQTPVADDAVDRKAGKWNSRGEPKLSAQVLIPTPTVHGNYNKKGASKNSGDGLATFVRMFPTATATAYKGWSKNHNRSDSDDRLDYTIEREANVAGQTGRLNPDWVEWLMGWPIGQTALKPLETAKFREWQQKHSCSYSDGLRGES